MRKSTVVTLVVAVALGACGPGADEEGPLVIYSGRSEELIRPLVDEFVEDTGIQVQVRYAGSTDLAATLLEEGEATEADLFFAQDPASLGAVAAMLSPLPSGFLDLVDPRFVDRQGRWVGTSGRVRTFAYHLDGGIELPLSIDDVTDPQWAGRIGIAPTNSSFLAFVAAMILERGSVETLRWLEALAANDPQDYPNNATIVAAVDSGEILGGLTNHYYLLRLRAEGAGDGADNWFIPAGDVGTLVMPAGVGILSGTSRPDAAQQFVEYMLSAKAQTYFAEEIFEFPVVAGIPSAPGTPTLEELDAPDVDLSRLAELLDEATRLVAEAGLV